MNNGHRRGSCIKQNEACRRETHYPRCCSYFFRSRAKKTGKKVQRALSALSIWCGKVEIRVNAPKMPIEIVRTQLLYARQKTQPITTVAQLKNPCKIHIDGAMVIFGLKLLPFVTYCLGPIASGLSFSARSGRSRALAPQTGHRYT